MKKIIFAALGGYAVRWLKRRFLGVARARPRR